MPKSCWAPCFSLTHEHLESRSATILIAWYTFVLHVLSLGYFIGLIRGERSDEFYSPLFEYGNPDMAVLATLAAIYSGVYLIIGCLGLVRGVKTVSGRSSGRWHDETIVVRYRIELLKSISSILSRRHESTIFLGYGWQPSKYFACFGTVVTWPGGTLRMWVLGREETHLFIWIISR